MSAVQFYALDGRTLISVDSAHPLPTTGAGGGSGGQQYAEDVAHVSGDLGTLALVVRQDVPAALENANGDYAPLTVGPENRQWVAAALQTDAIVAAGIGLTPKFASIAVAANGDNQIVAAVAGKKLRVLCYLMVAAGAVSVKWRSAANDRSGAMAFAANGGASAPFCPLGWLETTAAEALQLNLSAAVAVAGHVTYVEV